MPDFSDIRLLVVDDESALRNLLGEVLKDDGFNVRTADSGEQALALFEAEPADLVFSDMSMPGMSGIDLLKKVKELRGEMVEFVIITANATLDTAIAATKHGATDYLRKPVEDIGDISRLAARISVRIRERRLGVLGHHQLELTGEDARERVAHHRVVLDDQQRAGGRGPGGRRAPAGRRRRRRRS